VEPSALTLAQPGAERPAAKVTTPSKSSVALTWRSSDPLEEIDCGTAERFDLSPLNPLSVIVAPAEPGSVSGRPLGPSVKLAVGCCATSNAGVPDLKLSVKVSPAAAADTIGGGPDWGSDSGDPKGAEAGPEEMQLTLAGASQPTSRAAYIGGCFATSNVLAGKVFGIPVRGTHAHSWVMAYETEYEAFEAYAQAMPGGCVFLVDTYDSIEGIRHAVEVGNHLRSIGKDLGGIRLDSGDLSYLSIAARDILDQAGFNSTQIIASNDLDEHVIASLKEQGALIDLWGVGTKLVTAFDQPALGGVYKLGAIRSPNGPWHRKVKLSEQAVKVSNPGSLQVRRFEHQKEYVADMIFDELNGSPAGRTIVNIADLTVHKKIPDSAKYHDLLVPIFRRGNLVYERPSIHQLRDLAQSELGRFYTGVKRLLNPHIYPVGLELGLYQIKSRLIEETRKRESENGNLD